MSVQHSRVLGRAGAALAATCLAVVLPTGTAWAHLEPVPGQAAKSKLANITFKVPNERPDAGTVQVRLDLPAEYPLLSVRVRTTAGWKAEAVKAKLDKPVKSGNSEITEAFRTITWTAAPGTRIAPGEFAEFAVTFGPMPANTDKLVINAVQTYDSGEVVNWNQPSSAGAEPEHPAPTIALSDTGAGESTSAPDSDTAPATATSAPADSRARWLGGSGLAVGSLALGIAIGLALRSRRSRPEEEQA